MSSAPSAVLRVDAAVAVAEVEAMTRLGCQWDRQPIAALPFPVAEALPGSTKAP